MRKETAVKLTMVLGIIAALLAFAAAVITYIKDGEIKMSLIAAGLFLLAFALGAKNRIGQNK